FGFISRSSERAYFELGVVTPFSGAQNVIEPSFLSVQKKAGLLYPGAPLSWDAGMVSGLPGLPVGSCNDQIERSKLPPGGRAGSSAAADAREMPAAPRPPATVVDRAAVS